VIEALSLFQEEIGMLFSYLVMREASDFHVTSNISISIKKVFDTHKLITTEVTDPFLCIMSTTSFTVKL
jgi:hypothetical protein